jgi:hypothetical protein
MEGWLCLALFKYFADAPLEIHIKAVHALVLLFTITAVTLAPNSDF